MLSGADEEVEVGVTGKWELEPRYANTQLLYVHTQTHTYTHIHTGAHTYTHVHTLRTKDSRAPSEINGRQADGGCARVTERLIQGPGTSCVFPTAGYLAAQRHTLVGTCCHRLATTSVEVRLRGGLH